MAPAKRKRAAPARAKKKPPTIRTPTTRDVWARTQLLVEVLVEVMEVEIRNPDSERSEQWLKLFGAKDSAVVNLQKLVQLLGELQAQSPVGEAVADAPVAPVSEEELAMLSAWLRTTNAASVSTAAE